MRTIAWQMVFSIVIFHFSQRGYSYSDNVTNSAKFVLSWVSSLQGYSDEFQCSVEEHGVGDVLEILAAPNVLIRCAYKHCRTGKSCEGCNMRCDGCESVFGSNCMRACGDNCKNECDVCKFLNTAGNMKRLERPERKCLTTSYVPMPLTGRYMS